MKKVILTILTIFSLSYLSLGQVTVSGSTCNPSACFGPPTAVDGMYTFGGTDGTGRNSYNNGGGTIEIGFNSGSGQWEIRDCIGSVYYTNTNQTTPNPPNINWSAGVGSCGGFPAPTLSGDVVNLPVVLVYFSGEILNSKEVYLKWQTASEENNHGFEIEHSQDGKDWKNIGFVEGNGTTIEVQEYSYTDEQPVIADNYYRLKQIDYDGQYEYSEIVTVTMKPWSNETLTIFPNPVKEHFTLQGGVGQVIIYNTLGQPVRELRVNNEQAAIPTSSLAQGHYLLQVTRADGSLESVRFVKQ